MIKADAKLTIQRISLSNIIVVEFQPRYLDKLLLYIELMQKYPDDDAGLLHVTPSDTHTGMYALLDGHHKYCASIIVGKPDALCVIVEEPAPNLPAIQ